MNKSLKIITLKAAKSKDLKRYYTGTACKRGHFAERLVSTRCCLKCSKLYEKKYYKKNEAKLKKRLRQSIYYKKNILKIRNKDRQRSKTYKFKKRTKEYNKRDYVREKRRNYNKAYRKNNYQKLLLKDRIYKKEVRSKNTLYLLKENYRRRILLALKSKKAFKSKSLTKLLGCSIENYKRYLENKFYINPKTGETMSWENHGLKGWHIDHIKPLTNFNLVKIKEQMKAFNFKNTQPMWAYENLRKGKNQV